MVRRRFQVAIIILKWCRQYWQLHCVCNNFCLRVCICIVLFLVQCSFYICIYIDILQCIFSVYICIFAFLLLSQSGWISVFWILAAAWQLNINVLVTEWWSSVLKHLQVLHFFPCYLCNCLYSLVTVHLKATNFAVFFAHTRVNLIYLRRNYYVTAFTVLETALSTCEWNLQCQICKLGLCSPRGYGLFLPLAVLVAFKRILL